MTGSLPTDRAAPVHEPARNPVSARSGPLSGACAQPVWHAASPGAIMRTSQDEPPRGSQARFGRAVAGRAKYHVNLATLEVTGTRLRATHAALRILKTRRTSR